jgi:arylsulfatase A-like enzyme
VSTEQSTGFEGYNSIIPSDSATIGRILLDNGYRTAWFGKDHNTPDFQASQAGPFTQWPMGVGFDYFYGFVGGDTSQWQNLFRNPTASYPYVGNPKWNLTTAMADDAIHWMKRLNDIEPAMFLVYDVPGGTHAPHQPIDKISKMHLFDKGLELLARSDLRQPEEARRHPAGRSTRGMARQVTETLGHALPKRRSFSFARRMSMRRISHTRTAPSTHHTQYFERMVVRALYQNGWMLSTLPIRPPWELVGKVVQDPANA